MNNNAFSKTAEYAKLAEVSYVDFSDVKQA